MPVVSIHKLTAQLNQYVLTKREGIINLNYCRAPSYVIGLSDHNLMIIISRFSIKLILKETCKASNNRKTFS